MVLERCSSFDDPDGSLFAGRILRDLLDPATSHDSTGHASYRSPTSSPSEQCSSHKLGYNSKTVLYTVHIGGHERGLLRTFRWEVPI